jgi:hypothetical protein
MSTTIVELNYIVPPTRRPRSFAYAPDEVLLKCYGSRTNVARFTPHTSFLEPDVSADAPRRGEHRAAHARFVQGLNK